MNFKGCISVVMMVSLFITCKPKPAEFKAEKYESNWESLSEYDCPEWFTDAKFGIWAHSSPQDVPMEGDWYAHNMYKEGHANYKYHVENYGHPSEVGYKDLLPKWTLDKWKPDSLMQLYKRAGARYFVALANHHCNFDTWNSKHQNGIQ
ncbi:alpha-L-fucosidase [Algibacter lectus]|uniref:alpha-L-fucosidase n=1 Tax=Algibacter lectus TaxID=221126 RepID=A0A090WYP8_9FLAO|nr:alpha-L-fucosidase [Algibacter lectus]GAL82096.1 alpha-L-fucosidase [Algibacter lectus]